MTVSARSYKNEALLRYTLIFDMLLCASFGLLFLATSGPVAAFLGIPAADWFVILLGVALVAAAIIVYVVTFPLKMNRRGVWIVVALNASWVVLSYIVAALGIFSRAGGLSAVALADVVFVVAALEFFSLWRSR